MTIQPSSKIYLLDHLANHQEYVDEIAQLKFDHWHHTSPDRPWDVWLSEIAESAQLEKTPLTLVALYNRDGEQLDLAGFVTLIHMDEHAGISNGLWMITLYVKPAYRRKGIGTHLINHAISESKRLAYKKLYLWSENKELTAFYNKRGWQVTRKDEESGEDVMVFDKAKKARQV